MRPHPRGAPAGRRRWALLALGLVLSGVAASTSVVDTVPGRGPGTDPVAVSASEAAADFLDQQSRALLRRDAQGWSAGVDPAATTYSARHAAVFQRLLAVPVTSWGYQVLEARRRPDRADPAGTEETVLVRVRLAYRLVPDSRDLTRDRTLTLTRRSGVWLIRSDTEGEGRSIRDPWEWGPILVRRTAHCLLIADASTADLMDQVLAETRAADALLSYLWPDRDGPTPVILLAADLDQTAGLLPGIDRDTLASIAAATTGPRDRDPKIGAAPNGTADRVVLNGAVFRGLTDVGRHVVVVHELTHVLTRATARVTPPAWLEEGIADYVAYLGTGLRTDTVMGELISAVAQGQLPADLPQSSDFTTGPDTGVRYEQAWSAVVLISGADPGSGAGADPRSDPAAARHWQRLRRFYRVATTPCLPTTTVAGTSEVAVSMAFDQVLGTTAENFLERWQKVLLGLTMTAVTGHHR